MRLIYIEVPAVSINSRFFIIRNRIAFVGRNEICPTPVPLTQEKKSNIARA